MSQAERDSRRRRRRRDGTVVLPVEVQEIDFSNALFAEGFLPEETDDRLALTRGLQRVVDLWVREITTRGLRG